MSLFSQRLKAIIEYRRFSQKELALRLNISPSTLNGYVLGSRQPDYNTLKKICKVLNVPISFLLDAEIDTVVKNNFSRRCYDVGVDMEMLSRIFHIDEIILSGWERGQLELEPELINEIAEFLKVSTSYLNEFTSNPTEVTKENEISNRLCQDIVSETNSIEYNLLINFRKLNDKGKSKIIENINDLIASGNYSNETCATTDEKNIG